MFICPYTRCGSVHESSEFLQEHIESCHRQQPRIPTEPEVICYEGPDNVIEDNINRISDDGNSFDNLRSNIREAADNGVTETNECSPRNETLTIRPGEYNTKDESRNVSTTVDHKVDYNLEYSKLRAALCHDNYSKNNDAISRIGTKFPKNKAILITKENFFVKYEARSPTCTSNESVQIDSSQDPNNTVFINNDISLTKNLNQEHRIELGNLEKAFRSGFEQNSIKAENNTAELKNNCSDDEEYTPKKQRMSRSKQEQQYKCEINGCGKVYKYVSHFRHHQDSHKIIANQMNANPANNTNKQQKAKPGKATTVSFFV